VVLPDPGGLRVGSGGATLQVLRHLASENTLGRPIEEQRVLLIHSGGDSRRLPHASAAGKLFTRVPRILPDGRASTIFDEFLVSLSGLVTDLPPGMLVASGDVLVVFDHTQLSFLRPGVIGVAAAAPAAMGRQHGVYVTEPGTHHVRAYLHKPPGDALRQWRASADDGTIQIDTGLVWMDVQTAFDLYQLSGEQALTRLSPGSSLNLYGDLLLPMAESTSRKAYLDDTSDGPATPALREARELIWERLRGTALTVEQLIPAVFVHFGTTSEYVEVLSNRSVADLCGWVRYASAYVAGHGHQRFDALVLANSIIEVEPDVGQDGVVVLDSHLSGPVVFGGAALVSGVVTEQELQIPRDIVVHQVPVDGGYVTRVFGLADDPKEACDAPGATFLNCPWSKWIEATGISLDVIWPGIFPGDRTLWNAHLYPVTAAREESLRLSFGLVHDNTSNENWLAEWRAMPRLSLAEGFLSVDSGRLLADIEFVQDNLKTLQFEQAVLAERPAEEYATCLGSKEQDQRRRARLVAQLLAGGDPLVRLRGYKALAVGTGDCGWEDQAFDVLSDMIRTATIRSRPASLAGDVLTPADRTQCTRVQAAARIDFGGGWTDTPPYSIETGGTVLNSAVTFEDVHPITVDGAWLDGHRLVFESGDIQATLKPRCLGDVLQYSDPADPFALLKAAAILSGLVPATGDPATPIQDAISHLGAGLCLTTRTSIPRGSGLGASSILAGAVLACVARMTGRQLPHRALFGEVLSLEQMLTTGGGWQDQVGGLVGGIKLITTAPGLPQRIDVQSVQLSERTSKELSDRLLLVYTGQQRLAKNLLRSMMGLWMARDPRIVKSLKEIGQLAKSMHQALEAADIDSFGDLIGRHWQVNKHMNPGCTNPFIDGLFDTMGPMIRGGKLVGAGGGGFALAIARSASSAQDLRKVISDQYGKTPVRVWECGISAEGLVVSS
jgi:fucokinase